MNAVSEHASTAVVVTVVTAVFLLYGLAIRFPRRWVDVLEIVGTSVTLVMVFVIQHTHARQQASIQLKLDEIVRSLPSASNEFIHVEQATEAELAQREAHHTGLRNSAIDQPSKESRRNQ